MSVEESAGRPAAAAMPSVSFKFCTAKVAGEGEDADPILRVGPDLGLLGVFDGMGGAGGRVYDTPEGRHTGAWIAARFARNVVERLMLELIKPEWNLDGPATVASCSGARCPRWRHGWPSSRLPRRACAPSWSWPCRPR